MDFSPFVIPFLAGTLFLFGALAVIYGSWIMKLTSSERTECLRVLFSRRVVGFLSETVKECLLHFKIFRTNKTLGYMHTSLAFGWFLLIVIGHIEASHVLNRSLFMPYYAIFLRYFEPYAHGWANMMDVLLLLVLSGVCLAYLKRIRSKWFGMKKTMQHNWGDRLALSSLWFIFPLRWLAESLTSGRTQVGGFFTLSSGKMLVSLGLPVEMEMLAWWAYSCSLAVFFVAMPFSRYMHILTEPLLILFRRANISFKGETSPRAQAELNACSRCGICIDACQLSSSLNMNKIQPAYLFRSIRYHQSCSELAENCLMCGRCSAACPVSIDSLPHRLDQRKPLIIKQKDSYSFLPSGGKSEKADILYFAGCMGHLTPSVIQSMERLFTVAGVKWSFMDKNGSICCGRPLLLSGEIEKSKELIEANKKQIKSSGATILVTSCPICYKMFKENYQLDIQVLHHSQWLQRAIEQRLIAVSPVNLDVTYHDPCELGRGAGIYEEPRKLIQHFANLLPVKTEREKALCCGASLANTSLSFDQQRQITEQAWKQLTINHPEVVATACPLCKKTFTRVSDNIEVKDIAELTLYAYEQRTQQANELLAVEQIHEMVH